MNISLTKKAKHTYTHTRSSRIKIVFFKKKKKGPLTWPSEEPRGKDKLFNQGACERWWFKILFKMFGHFFLSHSIAFSRLFSLHFKETSFEWTQVENAWPHSNPPPPLIKQHTNSFSLLFSPKNSSLYRRLYRFDQWNVYFDTSQYQYIISDLPLFFIFINMCVCLCVCYNKHKHLP